MFAHAKFAITMLVYFFNVTLWFLDTFFKSMDFLGIATILQLYVLPISQ